MEKFHIGDRIINSRNPCYIIAEIGLNHNGKEGLAIKLVEEAVKAGADAIKFSRFNVQQLMSGNYSSLPGLDGNVEMIDFFKRYELSLQTMEKVAGHCKKLKIDFLSTPFDEESVDLLLKMGVPALKVASGDLTNDPFLKYIAGKKVPVIMSTGMSTLEEVKHAVEVLRDKGCPELALLHCVSDYPATHEELNLRAITALARDLKLIIGFSDHTVDAAAAPVAVAVGACIIEKYLTLNKELPGPNHRYSLDPFEMGRMIRDIRDVELMLGVEKKVPSAAELEYRKFGRRSIVARVPIEAGTLITEDMLAMKRPGTGISPQEIYKVLGKTAKLAIAENEILTWDNLI